VSKIKQSPLNQHWRTKPSAGVALEFVPFTDPVSILAIVRKLTIKNHFSQKISDKNYQMIQISKKDIQSHLTVRYRGLALLKKVMAHIFPPSLSDGGRIRYTDFYKIINGMLNWSRQDQLGFCFYLLDYNNDGFICIEDLFSLLRELNDQDQVIREDVYKLISILKQKGRKLRQVSHISPIIYGIYDKYENKGRVSPRESAFEQEMSKQSGLDLSKQDESVGP